MRGLGLSWLLLPWTVLSSQGGEAATPITHDLSPTSTTSDEVHVTVFIDCPAGEFVDPAVGAYYSTSTTVTATVTITSYQCSALGTSTATEMVTVSLEVEVTSTIVVTVGPPSDSPPPPDESSPMPSASLPPSAALPGLTTILTIPGAGISTVSLAPGQVTTITPPAGDLTTISAPGPISGSSLVTSATSDTPGPSIAPTSPATGLSPTESYDVPISNTAPTQALPPGGLTTTVTIPGIGVTTFSLDPGQGTTLSLPSDLSSTIVAPSEPLQTTTVVSLPDGQSITVTLPTSGSDIVSLSGVGQTTISAPNPPPQTTVASLPSVSMTTITLPASGTTSNSLPGISTTGVSVPSTSTPSDIPSSSPTTTLQSTSEQSPSAEPSTGTTTAGSSEGSSSDTATTTIETTSPQTSETQDNSPSTPVATTSEPASTPSQPTGTGTMTSDADPTTGFMPLATLYVTVESIEYFVIDDGDPLVIMLDDDDGTGVTVAADRVTIGSATIMYPLPITSPTTITQEGHTVTLRPRPYQTPSLGSTPQETQAAGVQILKSYAQWGNDLDAPFTNFFQSLFKLYLFFDIPAGEQPPSFLGPLDSLLASVSSTATALDSVLSAGPFSAFQDFATWAQHQFQVSNPGGNFLDWLDDLLGTPAKSLIRNIGRTLPGALSKIQGLARMLSRHVWQSVPKLEAHLVKYKLQYLGGGTGTGISIAVGVVVATLTKTSGPGGGGDLPKKGSKRSWYVKCNEGTSYATYMSMIAWIDGAAGYQVGSDPKYSNTGQGYFTTLDEEVGGAKMKQVKQFPFITFADPHFDAEQTERLRRNCPIMYPRFQKSEDVWSRSNYTNITDQADQAKPGMDGVDLDVMPAPMEQSFIHRRLMSMKSSDQLNLMQQPIYWRDETQGQGTTVFVMDSGFDLGSLWSEFRLGTKSVPEFAYVPPEYLMQADRTDPWLWPDNGIYDCFLDDGRMVRGHGTGVAACAIGTTHGIASKADAYFVKVSSVISNDFSQGTYFKNPLYPCALDDAFQHIIKVIEQRGLQGKAVINFSMAVPYGYPEPEEDYMAKMDVMFTRNIFRLAELGVIFCTGALNQGWTESPFIPLGDSYPQLLGLPENNIVTVGGVAFNGLLQSWSSPEGSFLGSARGSVTVYAQAIDVDTFQLGGIPAKEEGNSFAAPQVAGLIAYFLALPENAELFKWTGDGFDLCRKVKQYLVDRSYRRIRLEDQHTPGLPPYPIPGDVNVAYNNAWGPQVPCGQNGGSVVPNQDPRDGTYQCPVPTAPLGPASPTDLPTGNMTMPLPPPANATLPSGGGAPWNTSAPLPTTASSTSLAAAPLPTTNPTISSPPSTGTSTTASAPPLSSTSTTTSIEIVPISISTFTFTSTSTSTPSPSSSSSAALPTTYYNAESAAGCANAACSACTDGFRQSCVAVEDKREVQCACVWTSACARDQRHRGECDKPCPDPSQVRDCEAYFPPVDPISYPNGFCRCVHNACKRSSDCTGTCGPQGNNMYCDVENGNGTCKCP